MLGQITTSKELLEQNEKAWEEIHSTKPQCSFKEMYMPWLCDETMHPAEGVYIGYLNNFPSFAFDETKDLPQKFWWCFNEMEPWKRGEVGPNGMFVDNPEYLGTPYGTCDEYEQALEYLKPFIDCKEKTFIVWMYPIWHHPENAGQTGGYRPYKNGQYLGKYKDIIDSHEYFDDCVFPEDFKGYIFGFHCVRIK